MFGSDWPVCTLAGSYEEVYHALLESLGPISENERMKIFGGTAQQFYNLPLSGPLGERTRSRGRTLFSRQAK
jgi:L-fuconolactonase